MRLHICKDLGGSIIATLAVGATSTDQGIPGLYLQHGKESAAL
jgi:hypothetical protein